MLAKPQLPNVNDEYLPQVAAGSDPSILALIYDNDTNIAIWQRDHQQGLDEYAQQWLDLKPTHSPCMILSVDRSNEILEKLLPDL